MKLLFPDFRLIHWLGFLAAYIFCLLDVSPEYPDMSLAILPVLGGIALAAGVGTSIYGAYKADQRQKEAIAAQKAAEKRRRADIKKAYGGEAKAAKARLKRPDQYGLSEARQREGTQEITRSAQAATKSQLAELDRGAGAAPFASGRREAIKRNIAGQTLAATGAGRLGTARLSEDVAQQQQAADRAITKNYASMLAGLPASQVPSMMMQSPGMGERMAGIAGQAITGAAMMGAFSGPGKPALGGASQYAAPTA